MNKLNSINDNFDKVLVAYLRHGDVARIDGVDYIVDSSDIHEHSVRLNVIHSDSRENASFLSDKEHMEYAWVL